MEVKKFIKKIAILGTGALMVGSTILGASATANLNNYPGPFVSDGQFNALMVVGNTAAPVDIIGAIDIAASLQYNMKIETPVIVNGETVTSIAGGKKIETAGSKLRYGNVLSNVLETILPEDLPTVLIKEGKITGEDNEEYTYKTSLKTPNSEIGFGEPGDLESPVIYLDVGSNVKYTAVIEFPKAVDLKQLVDINIVLFGREYTVSGKESELDSETLTLYGGALDQTFTAGTTTTLDGDTDVEVLGVNTQSEDPTATLKINGESKSVVAGKSYKIGGVDIYVKDVFAYTAPVTSGAVRLYIGSDEVVLKDGNNVEVKNKDIEGTSVTFISSGDKVSKIEIDVTPASFDDEIEYIEVGEEGFVDPIFGTFKFALTNVNPALDSESREEIKIIPSSNKLRVDWINKNDVQYNMDMFYEENGVVKFGNKVGTDILIDSNDVIDKNDYFIISKEGYSHILQLSKVDNDPKEIQVKDDSETYTFSYSGTTGTMTFDGYSYPFTVLNTGTNAQIKVTGLSDKVITEKGAELQFTIDSVETCNTYPANAVIQSSIVCDSYSSVPAQTPTYTAGTNYIVESTISCPDVNIPMTPVFVEINSSGLSLPGDVWCENTVYTLGALATSYDTVIFNSTNYVVINSIVCDDEIDTSVASYNKYVIGTDIPGTCVMSPTGAKIIFNEASDYNDETISIENDYANSYVIDITDSDGIEVEIDVQNPFDIGNGDNYLALTPYGTKIAYGNNDEKITISYFGEATTFDVFVAPTDAVTVVTGGSEYTTDKITKISVGMAKLASEIGNIAGQNLITIGGPCVNAVSAALMGNPTNCAAGFEEGKATIKLFEQTNGNVALMVAGYSADDTRRATSVVSDFDKYTGFEGTEINVYGTSMNDISISAPVVTTTADVTTTTLSDAEEQLDEIQDVLDE